MDAAAALIVTARDAEGAIAAYLAIQKDHPGEIRPIYNLARLYVTEENWTAAREWFIRYRDHPDFPQDRRADVEAQIAGLQDLINNDADPEKRKTRRYLLALEDAGALLQAGDREGAFAQARIASTIDPVRPEAYAMAAAILMDDGDCEGATAFLDQGLELAKDDEARDLLGKAAAACEETADYAARTAAAKEAFESDRTAEAAKLYEQIAVDFPNDHDSALAAATAYALAGDYQKSADLLKPLSGSGTPAIADEAKDKLAQLAPFLRPAAPDTRAVARDLPGADIYARGVDALNAGDAEDARLLLDQAIRQIHLSADMADYFLARGRARGQLDELDGAIADYRLASLLDPSRSETHVALASILVKADKIPQAVSEISTAMRLETADERVAGLRVMRGRLHERVEDFDSAFEDYKAAIEAGADSEGIVKTYHERAVSLALRGRLADARQAFERGRQIGSNASLERDYEAFRKVTFAVLNSKSAGIRTEIFESGDWNGDWIKEKWNAGYSVTDLTWGHEKWTVVMAVDEAIKGQRLRFSEDFPKDEIKAAWDERLFIDRIVAFDGGWMLLASERDYSGQSWIRREKLDKAEVLSRIREEGEITELAFADGSWIMVNSRGSGLRDQKVETDTSYPETAIRNWTKNGYALTRLAYGGGVWWAVFSKGDHLGASEIFSANLLTGQGVNSLERRIQDGWDTGMHNLFFAQVVTEPK
ncbi:tetratricopeptide repeat protein [Roseibium sp. M-1]